MQAPPPYPPPVVRSVMAPRLSHKKTRTGCKRCKARKVKCDEAKPKCGACTRHQVDCEYPIAPYGESSASPAANGTPTAAHTVNPALELRLMHEWMAYTCMSLTTTWEFWKYQAPVIAFDQRYIMDGMFALTALYASRQKSRYWSALEGKMLAVEDGKVNTQIDSAIETGWKRASEARKAFIGQPSTESMVQQNPDPFGDMLDISRKYFAAALEGHQRNVAVLGQGNFQAVFVSSILVCYYALFTLSEDNDAADSLNLGPLDWFKLCRGTTVIVNRWRDVVGDAWFLQAGGMYGEPDLTDNAELFKPEHMDPFKYLLLPVGADEIGDADREAYEHALSYVGLIYKGIAHKLEGPLATGRRVIAMPARCPQRFGDLVEAGQPRAIAILAHTFASMRLAEESFPWFQGIAQRQVPVLCNSLPEAWQGIVQWPMEVALKGAATPHS